MDTTVYEEIYVVKIFRVLTLQSRMVVILQHPLGQRRCRCGAGNCVFQSMLFATTAKLAHAHNRSKIYNNNNYFSFIKKCPYFKIIFAVFTLFYQNGDGVVLSVVFHE